MANDHDDQPSGVSGGMKRRGFLSTLGAGVAGVTVAGKAAPSAPTPVTEPATIRVALIVNGERHRVAVEPRWSLLHVLREHLGLTGAKPGCERGECGACTVLVDGVARYACLTLAVEADGHEITTIEGLLRGEELGPVQQAFVEEDGMQCGYCTPGQIMAAEALLRKNAEPGIDQIREGVSGNICRCGAYDHIFKSVRRAAELRKQGGTR